MVLGCSSSAGKSLLVTALVRWFADRGVDVAPYKAQNMSNNARVVDGGEIGVAQWLQAQAGRLQPTVDMNPVLLKPEGETRSQVVVAGRARHELAEIPWEERGPHLWPAMADAFERLRSSHELIILEGAGSPAEINLEDLVNNQVLELADASALLVADIDRGGAFAHLYGTWALVPEATRKRLRGFILNRFRGDIGLLEPGPSDLARMTGMRAVGVVPMLQHDLPDEEGAIIRDHAPDEAMTVAIVRWPYASNLDEFHLLSSTARVRWAVRPDDVRGADLVILPGSKNVAADTEWLRGQELDRAIAQRVANGGRTLGVCGGAMVLGASVSDPAGVEGPVTGLGLMPLITTMDPEKVTTKVRVSFSGLPDPWNSLNGTTVEGYEIRHGRVLGPNVQASPHVWIKDSVMATTVHGLLEDVNVLEALTGLRPEPIQERTFDLLAEAVETHLDTEFLLDLAEA